jgi:hypothetical protein
MINGVCGNLGKGKTATLTKLALHYNSFCQNCHGTIKKLEKEHIQSETAIRYCECETSKPTTIHANFWIEGIENFKYITALDDIGKIHHGYVFFDELWSWIDARGSGFNDINQIVTGILLNSRKRGYSIFFESKLPHMIDRRIKELTDIWLLPRKLYNNNGELIELTEDMLNPIDIKPYINDMWVIVLKCYLHGDQLREYDGQDFQYKLTDVTNRYSTTEEIKSLEKGEKHAGLEKGIKIEDAFERQLKGAYPLGEILRGEYSRGWDVRIKANGQSCCFDVVSVRDSQPGRTTATIDIRGKKIKEMLQEAKTMQMKPFWAFSHKGIWYKIPMIEEHIRKGSMSIRKGAKI